MRATAECRTLARSIACRLSTISGSESAQSQPRELLDQSDTRDPERPGRLAPVAAGRGERIAEHAGLDLANGRVHDFRRLECRALGWTVRRLGLARGEAQQPGIDGP